MSEIIKLSDDFNFLVRGTRTFPVSPKSKAILLPDNWDDMFRFQTQFTLVIFDEHGNRFEIGSVKFGQKDMQADQRKPDLPPKFDQLAANFFSLGQDDTYYEQLNALGTETRQRLLMALNDIAASQALWNEVKNLDVTQVSLLRSISETAVERQFHRLSQGGARLTKYAFVYHPPKPIKIGGDEKLLFNVQPHSNPPTNIQVLIGRNGVGKTFLLNLMTLALVGEGPTMAQSGFFTRSDSSEAVQPFANLVSVSFSAFDHFKPLSATTTKVGKIRYSYIGLKNGTESENKFVPPKSPEVLAKEFVASLKECKASAKAERWKRAMSVLETDRMFRDAEISELISKNVDNNYDTEVISLFKKLSSGHAIVLLTMTRLVETVEESTLVLLDEPEAHLHPPLLSAFIRSLSGLLINRNGVAIVATHSPVILQEVPKSCVWKLRRTNAKLKMERPNIETFGENVGILTREVFGLEVARAGFHAMLTKAVERTVTFDDAVEKFNGELGGEARAILRTLILAKAKRIRKASDDSI